MPQPVSVSIDVSNVAQAIEFYTQALGCGLKTSYSDTWSVLSIGALDIHLLEKEAGTVPAAGQTREYQRHWTPVHLDFGVTNVESALAAITQHGGLVEEFIESEAADIAHCADPFGNGFCLIRESI